MKMFNKYTVIILSIFAICSICLCYFTFTKDDIEEKIYSYISKIDDVLLEITPNYLENNEISEEQKLDLAILYINQNYKNFKDRIKILDKTFEYELLKTPFSTNEYIDVYTLKEVVNYFFEYNYYISDYKFYDKEIGLIALLSTRGEFVNTNNLSILSIEKKDNTYYVMTEYINNYFGFEHVFNVKYEIVNNNSLELNKFVVYNSEIKEE